ncbi:MAG TPA: YlxR family protein [Candidatus Limnocylindrales bacterium]
MACRTARAQRDLLRIVRSPEGEVRLDPAGRTPGRGAYVCRDDACISAATERGLLSRALTSPIPSTIASELRAAVEPTIPGGFLGQE